LSHTRRICLAVVLSCSGIAGAAEPSLWLDWLASSDPSTPFSFDPADQGDVTSDQNGGMIYTGSLLSDSWQLSWTTRIRNEFDSAYMDTGISVINLSSETQTFSLDTRMSLSDPLVNPATVDLAASLALTNTGFTGTAEVRDDLNESIVQAGLNGDTSDDLFNGPYLLQANGPFSSAVDSAATSMMPTLEVLNQMSLLTTFQLSPGDLLNLTIVMDVSNIPAPGVLSMIAVVGLIGTRSRRRTTSSGGSRS
jgi:hypothetical protein